MALEPLRELQLPDGSTVYNVPDEVTDQEIQQAYVENKPPATEEESLLENVKDYFEAKSGLETKAQLGLLGLFGHGTQDKKNRDLVKATINMGTNAYDRVVGGLKDVFDQFETEEEKREFSLKLKKQKPELYFYILNTLGIEPAPDVQKGKAAPFNIDASYTVRPNYETLTGPAAEIVPYLIGPALTTKAVPLVATELAASQLFANPEDNLIDSLKEYLPTEEAFTFVKDAIYSGDLSPEKEQQAKLFLGDGIALGLVLPLALVQKTYRMAKAFGTKPISMLSKDEKAELYLLALRDARNQVESQASKRRVREDSIGQVAVDSFKNMGSAIQRTFRQLFTSSGFMPETLYREQLNLVRKNKQAVENAGSLSKKLSSQLNSLAGEIVDSSVDMKALVSDLLAEGIRAEKQIGKDLYQKNIPEFLSLSSKENRFDVIRLQSKYDAVPDDIVNTVLDIRQTMDSYSGEFLRLTRLEPTSDARAKLIRKVQANFGGYLNRAYQKHEGGWTPSKRIVEDGIEYFAARIQRRDESIDPALAYQQAEDMVEEIIKMPDVKNGLDFNNFNQVTTGIFKSKEEIPAKVRELMGEMVDPSEQTLTTITKMAAELTRMRFLDEFYQQGRKGQYLFAADELRNKKIYTYQIKDTGSKLDGKWTTPELGLALQNRETSLFPILGPMQTKQAIEGKQMPVTLWTMPAMLGNKSFIANLAEAKGASQKMQTVWRLLSHLRNGAGGSFLAFSNGHNPFSGGLPAAMKIITKSDEASQEAYEKLQGLGVVSNSTRFSEFKELLNEYKAASASPDELIVAEKFFSGASNVASKIGTSKYNLQTADELLQKVYVGTDDFFKTSLFYKELDTLREAFPTATILDLEKEAASKVTRTMPTYEEVFKGIKSFRYNPFFSTFVSFPAEMYRTTIHKFTIATSELTSGNSVLMKRGAERVAGLAVTLGGVSVAERTTSKFLGWTEEQLEAYKTLNSVEWGEQSYVFSTNDEGKPIAHNISYTDPHQNVKAPILRISTSLREGEITKEEADEKLLKVFTDVMHESIKPFTSQSVINSASVKFYTAVTEGKRSGEGVTNVISGTSPLERFPDAFMNFMYDVGPGVLKEANQLRSVLKGDLQGFFLEPANQDLFLSKYLTTSVAREVDTYQDIEKAFKLYSINNSKIDKASSDDKSKATVVKEEGLDAITPSVNGFVDAFIRKNTAQKENAQVLYLKMKAFESFHSESTTGQIQAKVFLERLIKEYGEDYKTIYSGLSPVDTFSDIKQIREVAKRLVKQGELSSNLFELREELRKYNVQPDEGRELNKGSSTEKWVFEDLRTGKAEGGLNPYSRVSRFGEEQAAKRYGITPEVLKKYTEDTATLVNKLVDKGFFHERERAKPNNEGNLSGGDVFNAANHLRTAALAEDNITLRNLAQLKELAQFVAGDRGPHGALGDSKNNLLGFKFYDQAKGNKEKFDTLVAHNLVERFSKRKGKAVGGEVDVPNAPIEPDERIDKMTGLPYNLQAGIPFRDEEDPLKRLGLVGGGRVGEPLNRLGFAAGGILQAVKRGAKEFEGVKEQIELGAEQVSNAFKYLIDAKGVDEVVSGTLRVQHASSEKKLKEFIDPSEVKPSTRYGDNEFGDNAVYFAEKDSPFTATEGMAMYNPSPYLYNVEAVFDKAFVLTPKNIKELASLIPEDKRNFGGKVADVLKDKGYDGLIIRGFDDSRAAQKAVNKATKKDKFFYGIFQDQVISFDPKKNKILGDAEVRSGITGRTGNIAENMKEEDIAAWQKANKLSESKRQKQRPEVIQSLQQVLAGKKSIEEHNKLVDEVFPPVFYTKENTPEFPTLVEVKGAVGKKTLTGGRGLIDVDIYVDEGRRVSSRLDIPAYDQRGVWAVTLHEPGKGGKAFAYGQSAILKNVEFTTNSKDALDIAMGQAKGTIARIEGDWVDHSPIETYEKALDLLDSNEWVQVGMNPYKHSYFYDKATMKPLKSASEVIQVGPLVLAKKDKNLIYANADDFKVDLSPQSIKGKKKLRDQEINIDSVSFMEGGVA